MDRRKIRGEPVGKDHQLTDQNARRRVGIDCFDVNAVCVHTNLQFGPAESDGAPGRASLLQLTCDGVQRLQSGIFLNQPVCFIVGKPPFDADRTQCDTVSQLVELMIEPHLDGKPRTLAALPQAGEIRRQPVRKHAHCRGWKVNRR